MDNSKNNKSNKIKNKINYKEELERMELQQSMLESTCAWWEFEMKKTTQELEKLQKEGGFEHEQRIEFLENHLQNLLRKAQFEMKIQQEFEPKKNKLIFSRIAKTLGNN
jgi:hypothetical protein